MRAISVESVKVATQKRLLNDWSKAQTSSGFKMIYPLFTTTCDSMVPYASSLPATFPTICRVVKK